jgi:ribosomal protein S18 acetylase RimI-like enzyme
MMSRIKSEDFRIVRATERHIEGFHQAVASVAAEKKYLARTEAPPIEATREFVRNQLREGNPHYVALVGDRVVGWCDIGASKKSVFSHCGGLGMGVISEYRGGGIGSELMRHALRRAKEVGLERVELSVYESNQVAIHLYQRFGFVIEGKKVRAAKIDNRYENLIIMALFVDEYDP